MAVRTKSEIRDQITTLLASGKSPRITAADLRSVLTDFVDSFALQGGATPTPPAFTRYAAVNADNMFDGVRFINGWTSDSDRFIISPFTTSSYLSFATRADQPAWTDMREHGSGFNARGLFLPDVGDAAMTLNINGVDYQYYVSRARIDHYTTNVTWVMS